MNPFRFNVFSSDEADKESNILDFFSQIFFFFLENEKEGEIYTCL